MDKKLKKKIETQLVIAIRGVLSQVNSKAADAAGKKVKEAGKMVSKKFVKSVKALATKKVRGSAKKKSKAGKSKRNKPVSKNRNANRTVGQKRDFHGRFQKKK